MRRGRRGRVGDATWGAIVLALVAAGVYVAFAGVPFQGAYEVRAVVRQATELHARTPVRIAGVEVGRVERVERGPGATAIVTMRLDESARPLHTDATLKVRPRIFLEGNFFVDLRPGTPSAPELEEGGTIPLAQTATPVQLDEVLGTLPHATRADLRRLVHALAGAAGDGGGRAFARAVTPARGAFAGVSQLAEAFRGEREGDLSGLVRDGGATLAALARDRRALAELVTGLVRTTRGLASRRRALARSLRGLDPLVAEAGPALAAVDRSLPPLRGLLAELRPALREAPATLRLVPPLATELEGLLEPRELPALRRALAGAVPALARLEPTLQRTTEILLPVSECLRRNVVPTLLSPIEDPPHTTGAPVYRELLWALPGLASGSQNFDGNGPNIRYHGGLGYNVVSTGDAPSLGEPLVGLTSEPILGARPRNPGREPPLRPDVACAGQQPPDLTAETGPAPRQERVDPARVRALARGER